MSLLFNRILKEAQSIKDNLTIKEFATLIMDNELSINRLKRRLIKEHYEEIKGTKRKMDIMVDLEECYGVCENTIRTAIQE